MKVVFHNRFQESYTSDPASSPGRLNHALELLKERYPLVNPSSCSEEDVLLVHTRWHLDGVRRDRSVYPMAMLAAGAALKAADLAMEGQPAFALCRPPGHHASPDSCWGFCYFNNVAIAVEKLLVTSQVKKALIIDFDLHFGDGTSNFFEERADVIFWHVHGSKNTAFVSNLEIFMQDIDADIVAVSAGFDRHVQDWGGMLTTEDYRSIGEHLGSFAREKCQNRLFAVLEGGYNARSLGDSVLSFIEGVDSRLGP